MRLIDADALADALFDKRKNYPQWVADVICEMPTIDTDALLKEQEAKEQISDAIHETAKQFRQAIVRCKDCKHWSAERINDFNKCRRWLNVGVKNFATMGDWFCADGEAKE